MEIASGIEQAQSEGDDDQRAEALKRLDFGETARTVARTFGDSHMTILRLAPD